MFQTYKYKLKPTCRQYNALDRVLEQQRLLYNAALQERIQSYRYGQALAAKRGATRPDPKLDDWKQITKLDQFKSLTQIRADDPSGIGEVPTALSRHTIERADLAFQGFFRRLKLRSGKAGFPRFKPMSRWSSFGFQEFSGIRLKESALLFRGMPGKLEVHLHRPIPEDAEIKAATLTKAVDGWWVCFRLKLADTEPREDDQRPVVGIDVGTHHFAALSTGSVLENPRIGRRAARRQRVLSRALSRCRRGSKRRQKARERLARHQAKTANQRRTWLHQTSARLAREHQLIVVEDLTVRNMTRSAAGTVEEPGTMVRQKTGLNREILDVAMSTFVNMLVYKAERAGGRVVKVDPRYTSQDCSMCGYREKKSLSDRVHRCGECGYVDDRDVNAARNILVKGLREAGGVVIPVGLKSTVVHWPEKAQMEISN
ncbi:putative transposase [Thalassobaculum litoreum DSM 18839]|uniref:Putative transposase n=1 Tax=Thalassobaculum litoreum DSM 18839 TaxID=1123362 RepID=A0A8G2F5S0_9PROT|nr:putative transposase [Thalassobaculum litoreum DSM 18839]